MPRVSAVMAVHDGERYLAEAIESVLRQTYRDLELLVVDDGSTDRTAEILREYEAKDSRVVVLRPGRVGFPGALNLGIEHSRGEYIARMDADDVCLPTRLEKQTGFMNANPSISACGSAIEVFQDTRVEIVRYPYSPDAIRCHLLFHSPLCHPTVILRKQVLDRGGLSYRDEFEGVADYDLWSRMDRGGWLMANLPEVLLRYRRHSTQITTADGPRQATLADRVRAEHLTHYGLGPSPKELEVHSTLGKRAYQELRDSLREASAWLDRLESALRRDRRFSVRDLRALLADHWYAVCRFNCGLGWRIVRAYTRSQFGRGRPLRAVRLTMWTAGRSSELNPFALPCWKLAARMGWGHKWRPTARRQKLGLGQERGVLARIERMVAGKLQAVRALCEFAQHLRNWRVVWAAYRQGRLVSSPLLLRNGVRLEFGPGDDPIQVFREVFVRRCYDPTWFYRPRPGDAVIDLGANIGAFSLAIATQHREVRCHSFEPSAATRVKLVRNVEANGLAGLVRIYPYAVSGDRGTAMLKGGTSSIHASLFENDQMVEKAGERVEVITLIDAFRITGEERIALLKVDIEGAEKELFATISADVLAPVQRVVLEYHDHIRAGARAAVESKLRAGGFSMVRIEPADTTNGILFAHKR